MKLLVIRHGHAVADAPGLSDAGRYLSGKGRRITREVAAWLASRKKRAPRAIWTSQLVRAVQTAEILATAAELVGDVTAIAELEPARDPRDLLARIEGYLGPQPLALVGHEPFLSGLAHALTGKTLASFPKSGVLGVDWTPEGARSWFFLNPKTLEVTKS